MCNIVYADLTTLNIYVEVLSTEIPIEYLDIIAKKEILYLPTHYAIEKS